MFSPPAGGAASIPLHECRGLPPRMVKLDIRTPRHEVHDEIKPVIEYMERESSHNQVDNLVEGVRANGLAISGMQETLDALDHGQADILILANDVPFDERQRNELVRKAANTGAQVEIAEGHPVFQEMGGVGALLRYCPH